MEVQIWQQTIIITTSQTKTIVSFLAGSNNLMMIVGAYLRKECTIHEDEVPGHSQG